jgi:putative DNA methylase
MKLRKKLIEVALPLDAINEASAKEKSIRHGHPSTLHLWWARRPLAAARAVIFAQMVDDPGSWPEQFSTEEAQQQERERLFQIIRELVQWENTTNERVLNQAREEIRKSWRRTCAENQDHPRAKELFNPDELPAFHDPFAGGGSLPLEAQRLGLEAYASDLNPVAVLINKAMIEIPAKFAGRQPVNPESQRQAKQMGKVWRGAEGLAEDVRYYGKWMRDEAEKRIGDLYPKVEITGEMAKERADLKPFVGRKLTVIAWLWARTVKSPNPAFADVSVPLASTFVLSTKAGKEAFVQPVVQGDKYDFTVIVGTPTNRASSESGTKLGARGANFRCLLSDSPISAEYIRTEAQAGRMSTRLMAVVADSGNGRVYLPAVSTQAKAAAEAIPDRMPEEEFFQGALGFRVGNYGMTKWGDLFTPRQLVMLNCYSELVAEVRSLIGHDADALKLTKEQKVGPDAEQESNEYSDAVSIYLGLGVSKLSDYNAALVQWSVSRDQSVHVFGRHALPMVWDFAEVNPFANAAGDFAVSLSGIARTVETMTGRRIGYAISADAQNQDISKGKCVSTDPPYYDNIGYADLSDYFYIWLRQALRSVVPDLFLTLTVPKTGELVATPDRHGGREAADRYFLSGMTQAMTRISRKAHPAFPVSIYYAFKQAESDDPARNISTGWETFLDALIHAGFSIDGTWPIRTEKPGRMRENDSNALASSVVLVCKQRPDNLPIASRRELIACLKTELPLALFHLQRSNIAPVDLAQAAIGPGMAIYTRYSKVVDAEGKPLPVREALALINQTLDEVLAEQEGDFDSDTRWSLAWFEHSGFSDGEYGVAETLSKAKNTSVSGLERAGILQSKAGKVRLLRPDELAPDWDPKSDTRLTVWEVVHHLVRRLEKEGEAGAAELVAVLGGIAETARELAYRLYTICERKKRAQEALSYNALVQSWPEIVRLSREGTKTELRQATMFS